MLISVLLVKYYSPKWSNFLVNLHLWLSSRKDGNKIKFLLFPNLSNTHTHWFPISSVEIALILCAFSICLQSDSTSLWIPRGSWFCLCVCPDNYQPSLAHISLRQGSFPVLLITGHYKTIAHMSAVILKITLSPTTMTQVGGNVFLT